MGFNRDTDRDRTFLREWLASVRHYITFGWRFFENGRDVTRERNSDDLRRARHFLSILRRRESD